MSVKDKQGRDTMFGKESRASTIICIFCLIAGTILLAFSFKELYDYSNKSSEYVNANAKVIKHHYKDGKATAVIIEYKEIGRAHV